MAEYNERYPFGKNATVVTQDNINASVDALAARRRIQHGVPQPGDRELVQGRQASIDRVVNSQE